MKQALNPRITVAFKVQFKQIILKDSAVATLRPENCTLSPSSFNVRLIQYDVVLWSTILPSTVRHCPLCLIFSVSRNRQSVVVRLRCDRLPINFSDTVPEHLFQVCGFCCSTHFLAPPKPPCGEMQHLFHCLQLGPRRFAFDVFDWHVRVCLNLKAPILQPSINQSWECFRNNNVSLAFRLPTFTMVVQLLYFQYFERIRNDSLESVEKSKSVVDLDRYYIFTKST